jgi:hypothetical protein
MLNVTNMIMKSGKYVIFIMVLQYFLNIFSIFTKSLTIQGLKCFQVVFCALDHKVMHIFTLKYGI